ncbi:MAG TPA: aspartate kinase [Bryobacteraceae bacterium]|jgi:aspartate kinase|nr:aspartate kinase [Bryobacteraceae bacterium]
MTNLLVMKFGGTSMGSAERMRVAAKIILEEQRKRPVAVVVSAMSKVTDLLIETMRRAELGDSSVVSANVQSLLSRHLEACAELTGASTAVGPVKALVDEFQRICNGIEMLGERPPRSVDEAVAIGEQLSSVILATYLASIGTPAKAINAADVVVTDAVFGNASPHMEPTRNRCEKELRPLLERGIVPIVTGFNGATADGRPTTLGRGGSDFSAAILAAALDAAELWIWTDVDGIMTADPRLVENVAVLPEVTYAEAAELAYNGAKVLHPRTLAPLVERKIPVWSKNSFAPEKPGTKIFSHFDEPKGVRAVTSMSNVALISMEPANAALSGIRLMSRTMDALTLANIEILLFSSSSYRQSFCFLIRKQDLEQALEALESNLSIELAHGYLKPIEVDDNVGLLAVVGEGMRGTPGLAGRVFNAISRQNINIIAIAQGSSELTIAVVVRLDGLERAVRGIHDECRLSEVASMTVLS